jgi:ABC-type lipoprotein export system ATPase subunit
MTGAMDMIRIMNTRRDMSTELVGLENVRVRLGERAEARFPSFMLNRGERMAVTGPSGCGKSTLLNLLSGLLRPDSGEVRVAGRALGGLRPSELDVFRGRHIGMVHQSFHLLHGFTALENVMAGLRFGRRAAGKKAREEGMALLDRVGLADRAGSKTNRMSVGERQRVAIARALAGRPDLLLADEPTGALDPEASEQAMALMEQLCDDLNCGWICVTHDLDLAARFPSQFSCRDVMHRRGEAAA